MSPEALVPLMIVTGAILLVPLVPRTARRAPAVVAAMLAGLGLLLARYLHWRLTVTVMPADPLTGEGAYVWGLFAIEALAWLDAVILFAFLARRTDRSAEADWHEDRLRGLDPAAHPEVDIFIATYNEPVEVLEKTILGALALDWPEARRTVWVLDDGRRAWLADYARALGVGYLTREGNAGAKAGNINAAIGRTTAPFILVLDADFVPQRTFLYRAMGFFDDPRIGIVQIPHSFFNADPMQTSLNMSKVMPDDQRFFFEAIMPGRDGYDCAFCCGSNGIIRRSALLEIGGGLPTGSITEDMLLTIALKRRGYVTRYLNERLAFGLAPESINAFFIQRSRWARGGVQILFLRDGPFGRAGLALHERLFFMPTHWLTQSLAQTASILTPIVFLLFGLRPLLNTDLETILGYQLATIVATVAAVRAFAPGQYHPLASMAQSVLQAFRLLPVVLVTLVRPHGHAFKVTPKGGDGVAVRDTATVLLCMGLVGLTALGLVLNAFPRTQVVLFSHLIPVVTFWATLNMIVLLLVAKIAVTPPVLRKEERFSIAEPVRLFVPGTARDGVSRDMSLGGALISVPDVAGLSPGQWVAVEIRGVGRVPARITRLDPARGLCGLAFALPSARDVARWCGGAAPAQDRTAFERMRALRMRLVEKLFTTGIADNDTTNEDGVRIFWSMLRRIAADDRIGAAAPSRGAATDPEDAVPDWLVGMLAVDPVPVPARRRSTAA